MAGETLSVEERTLKPSVGIVTWGNPDDPEGTLYFGLRINGAYLGKPGKPRLWATRVDAMKAKRAYERSMAV